MLIKATQTTGYYIHASDGTLGVLRDMLFDDVCWTVRWLVVETGPWGADHRVLIPASALGHRDPMACSISVNLTMAQIKDSPEVDTHRPVSRQFESSAYDYYGFSPYWGTDLYLAGFAYWGGRVPFAPSLEMAQREGEIAQMQRQNDDQSLRSLAQISGYHIHATDGGIGHMADVLVDDTDWSLRYLIVNTSNWWQGKEVLIPPRSVQSIRWTEHFIYLGVNRDRIRTSPDYDITRPLNFDFDAKMDRHYGPILFAAAS